MILTKNFDINSIEFFTNIIDIYKHSILDDGAE